MSLRMIPGLTVLRPADANETVEAWRVALESKTASLLVLSRQDLAILDRSGANGDVSKGAYVISEAENADVTLLATGSEVELSLLARDMLAEHGVTARVVSMPSWELFEQQDDAYKASVLGEKGAPRVSVEAGTTMGWTKYTGDNGANVGMESYGASGNGKDVLKHFGFTVEHVAATALRLLGKDDVASELDKEFDEGHAAGKRPSGSYGHS
jgi:transketolase